MHPWVPVIVFSDVDRLLRNPRASAVQRAAATFRQLSDERVAVVLCSMKTRAELELIHWELGIRQPFIAEGGAAAFIPRGNLGDNVPGSRDVAGYHALEFGRPYIDVVRTLRSIAQRLRIDVIGFSDMSIDDVARDCSVSLLHARLAKLREYVEPYKLVGASAYQRTRLMKALAGTGLQCVSRADYEYVGSVVDYAEPVAMLRNLYGRFFGSMVSVGLVDAVANDTLLTRVDYKIIVDDSGVGSGAFDVGDWAESILETVQHIWTEKRAQVPGRPLDLGANPWR